MADIAELKSKVNTFTLLSGTYRQKGGHQYIAGQTVESEADLVKKYGANKFAYGDVTAPRRALGDDGLGALSIQQLRKFAVGEGIDVESVADDDVLAHVRRALYGL